MKKIINHKKYDTETAEIIATGSHEYPGSEYMYVSETLYLKKSGEFFLLGSESTVEAFSNNAKDCYYFEAPICIILDIDAIKRWASDCLSVEDYEAIWGEVSE